MSVLNRWSDAAAAEAVASYGAQGVAEALALRTYSARLLGADPDLCSMAAATPRSKPR